jgi:hypothetical protein
VQDLDPVTYSVSIEAPGFKRELVGNVKVDTASVAAINVTLQAGTVETQISVSAEAV